MYLKKTNQLIILTEFFIFELFFDEKMEKFILKLIVEISSIDFVTLSRNGKKMILHLVKNNNNLNNFILDYKQLEKIVGCIAASYFYDKLDCGLNKKIINRQISVIVLNEKFEIFNELEKIDNFEEYR